MKIFFKKWMEDNCPKSIFFPYSIGEKELNLEVEFKIKLEIHGVRYTPCIVLTAETKSFEKDLVSALLCKAGAFEQLLPFPEAVVTLPAPDWCEALSWYDTAGIVVSPMFISEAREALQKFNQKAERLFGGK